MLKVVLAVLALASICSAAPSLSNTNSMAAYNKMLFQELRHNFTRHNITDSLTRHNITDSLTRHNITGISSRALGIQCYVCHNIAECNDPFKTTSAIDCTGENINKPECDYDHDLGHTYLISYDEGQMGGPYKCVKVTGNANGATGTMRALVRSDECNAQNQFPDTLAAGFQSTTINMCCNTNRCNSASSLLVSFKGVVALVSAAILFMLTKN